MRHIPCRSCFPSFSQPPPHVGTHMSATDLPASISCIEILYFADNTVETFIPETAYIGSALRDGSTSITLTMPAQPLATEPVMSALILSIHRHVLAVTTHHHGQPVVRVVLPDSKIDLHVTSVFAQEYWLAALQRPSHTSSPASPRSPGPRGLPAFTDKMKRRGFKPSSLQLPPPTPTTSHPDSKSATIALTGSPNVFFPASPRAPGLGSRSSSEV